ncbi:MAG TPA: phosphoribosylformylglycinamidine synthase subunit PurS [Candidatus Acidoferrum sp.]|nr:phosphoribosylformylglycinamidine synthase subunit PurS [Candidatus Acidoferrum sp.]
MFKAEVFVTLKPVVNDPAGLTIRGGLHALGFDSVTDVRAGKYLVVTLNENDEATVRRKVDEMARQLLANEVIEDFRIEIQPVSEPVLAAPSRVSPSPSSTPLAGSRGPRHGGGQGGGS